MAPGVCGDVDAGQVGVLLPGAHQRPLHRGEALEPPLQEGPPHLAAGGHGVSQALAQEAVVFLPPALGENHIFHRPLALRLAPALFHNLEPVEAAEQLWDQLLLGEGAELPADQFFGEVEHQAVVCGAGGILCQGLVAIPQAGAVEHIAPLHIQALGRSIAAVQPHPQADGVAGLGGQVLGRL